MKSKAIWKARRADESPRDSEYAKFYSDYGYLLPKLLWSRQIESDTASKFLKPNLNDLESPFSIKNLETSALRLRDAILNKECIAIYGDYDMDGMSGLSILVSFLRGIGHERILHFQPHRFVDGYGVHPHAIRKLHEEGASVVVTVDTGSMAFDADDCAAELGIAYIITDHHQCDPLRNPKTPYFVNPNQAADSSKLKYLSGAGVAFYLAMGLRAKLREANYFKSRAQSEFNLLELLDLFSLGSIGDVVPLCGDNRVLVKYGLERLRQTQRPGLRVLLDAVLEGKDRIGARDVAFSVVPKLNSASRMGQAELSTKLLLESDSKTAVEHYGKIAELNTERSRLQKIAVLEAKAQAQALKDRGDSVLVLCGDWHEGILGIVAAKIAEDFFAPSIVLSTAHDASGAPLLRGSMRCPAPLHSLRILERGKDFLLKFGGHQAAAGLSLKAEHLDSFRSALQVSSAIEIAGEEQITIPYDAELEEIPKFFDVKALDALEPFGAGNPEPVFLIRKFPVGQFEILKDAHIKSRKGGVDFIGFNLFSQLQEITAVDSHIDMLVVPEISTFRFQEKVQLRIQAIRSSREWAKPSEPLATPAEVQI